MLNKETEGIKINVNSIHCIMFVDDITIITDPAENMKKLLATKFKDYYSEIQV